VLGYGLAALTKPLFPLATSASWIFTARFIDRMGKGIRDAPRDASGTPIRSAPTESRFQRLFAWRFEFLGRCPRLDFEIAPTALSVATPLFKSL